MKNDEINSYKLLVEVCKEDLLYYPKLTKKRLITKTIESIKGKKNIFSKIDRFSWPNSLLAIGLLEDYKKRKTQDTKSLVEKYVSNWKKQGRKIEFVDHLLVGFLMIELDAINNSKFYKADLEYLISILAKFEMDKLGSFSYRNNGEYIILADMIGMVCPFLAKYSEYSGDEKFCKIANKQIINYFNNGFEKKSFLPYHGYRIETQEKLGIVGWGRAVGWILFGMSECLISSDKLHLDTDILLQLYKNFLDSLFCYQKNDGSFSWNLLAPEGPSDSSATSLILMSSLKVQEFYNKSSMFTYKHEIDLGAKYLNSCIENGNVMNCSSECLGLGLYPQKFNSYPWSNGPTLTFFSICN